MLLRGLFRTFVWAMRKGKVQVANVYDPAMFRTPGVIAVTARVLTWVMG